MALSLDDRLLGEKVDNYCSSSEEEEEDTEAEEITRQQAPPTNQTNYTVNTGPKGVINDWRRYKQLETEKKQEQELEKLDLAKKLAFTCQTQLDEEREKAAEEELLEQLSELEDDFLKEYRQRRIEEMNKAVLNIKTFGKVVDLSKDNFVESVDTEMPNVLIVVHVYEDGVTACDAMNGCLSCLAKEYPRVKFCRIKASAAKLSVRFSSTGVPALLLYKNKELLGNFVRVSDELGNDFFATDVEAFLIEHGFLCEMPGTKTIRESCQEKDDDSDFDVD